MTYPFNLLYIYSMILGLICVPSGIYFLIWAVADVIKAKMGR